MQSQNGISTAKAQSVTAKTVYGTENYAFKSEKLAKSHEKINEVEQKSQTARNGMKMSKRV